MLDGCVLLLNFSELLLQVLYFVGEFLVLGLGRSLDLPQVSFAAGLFLFEQLEFLQETLVFSFQALVFFFELNEGRLDDRSEAVTEGIVRLLE